MANQTIALWGAVYSNVGAVKLPKQGGGTASFTEITDTTAAAADVASGKYFYTSAGVRTAGTASGGGGGGVTLVASKTITASTTSTTATTVETWSTGHSEIWTSDKIVYIKIRDRAGKRDNYFYGSDTFFLNTLPANGSSTASATTSVRFILRYNSTYSSYQTSNTTGYGLYADKLYNDGRIRLRQRYSSTYSLTINGTYTVEVYLLDAGTLLQ